jgi:predicted RNase H-like HicB family nuclease
LIKAAFDRSLPIFDNGSTARQQPFELNEDLATKKHLRAIEAELHAQIQGQTGPPQRSRLDPGEPAAGKGSRQPSWEEDPAMRIKVVITDAEEGGYTAEVPALPGCVTEGDTREELLANLREALEGVLLGADEPLKSGKDEDGLPWHEEEIDL